MSFLFESRAGGTGAFCRRLLTRVTLTLPVIALGLLGGARRGLSATRRLQLHARPPGFGEANSNRLLGGRRPMLTFANVVHFFAYEFSRLCAGGFSFARIFLSSFDCFFFGIIHLQAQISARGGGDCIEGFLYAC